MNQSETLLEIKDLCVEFKTMAGTIVSKAVIPSMIKKGHGKIINICSMMSELAATSCRATSVS